MNLRTLTTIGIALFTMSAATNAATFGNSGASLTACKQDIKNAYPELTRVKTADMKQKRNYFRAQFRIIGENSKGVMECRIQKDDTITLNCLRGSACENGSFVKN